MSMTGSDVLLDSSVWINYFFGADERSRQYVENAKIILFCSSISIFEVKKKFLKSGSSESDAARALNLMKKRCIVVDAGEQICEKSAADSVGLNLHFADSIIYRTALENKAELITMDSHFKGLEGVVML